MATTRKTGQGKGREQFFLAICMSEGLTLLQERLQELQKTDPKKAITLTQDDVKQMLTLVEQGATHISYERYERAEGASAEGFDTGRPKKELDYADVWVGKPGTPKAMVLLSNHAFRGRNAIIEEVPNPRGGVYRNTVGVQISAWAKNQDQAEYEADCKAKGINLPGKANRPTGDQIPTGKAAVGATQQNQGNEDIPFQE